MKHIKLFENFDDHTEDLKSKEELIDHLEKEQDVYDRHDLESMNIEQLRNLHDEVIEGEESDHDDSYEERSELEYESKKWIKDAIKRPGALRRKMRKKKGERITMGEIDSELQALKSKDRDPNKPGLQLSKRDKHKELVLAKTLKNLHK